jgi:hypothetical protein
MARAALVAAISRTACHLGSSYSGGRPIRFTELDARQQVQVVADDVDQGVRDGVGTGHDGDVDVLCRVARRRCPVTETQSQIIG